MAADPDHQDCESDAFRRIYTNMDEMRLEMDKQDNPRDHTTLSEVHHDDSGLTESTNLSGSDDSDDSALSAASFAGSTPENCLGSSTTTTTSNPEHCSLGAGMTSTNDAERHNCSQQGYFGLPRAFDLALLAKDVNTWNVNGLDPDPDDRCLRGTHVRLGSSLRARAATDAEKAQLEDKGVSLDNLRF
ncbi:MAG: hypothetical protein Q9181_004013 [Wetmoreana brouardii]